MATKKQSDHLVTILVAIISVSIGVFGKYIIDNYLTSYSGAAKTETVEGVYVFLKSHPEPDSYIPLGQVASNPLERTIQAANGRKGGDAFLNVMQSLFAEASMANRLNAIVRLAKEQHPDVEGVIFNSDLTSCEAIKFNN